MSDNLFKSFRTLIQEDDKRVIDVNALMEKRIKELEIRMRRPENEGFGEGFRGLQPERVEALVNDEAGASGNLIKAGEDAEKLCEEARSRAEEILADARAQAEEIMAQAEAQLQQERWNVLERARTEGYGEGSRRAQEEAQARARELDERERALEREYEMLVEQLEPDFVETITGIYEHIFHTDLSSYRDILLYLINVTMRKSEGTRDFIVHVSSEDYPYVGMQKKQLAAAAAGCTVEVIEDMTLTRNECLIETESGIFDCGVGTQLEELHAKLALLSYEKQVNVN